MRIKSCVPGGLGATATHLFPGVRVALPLGDRSYSQAFA